VPSMGWREAGRRWRLTRAAPVREEEEDGRLGREGGLDRSRGRGPVGSGRSSRLKREKMGHGWAKRPDGLAGRWAD
jgi:hypothetical protein